MNPTTPMYNVVRSVIILKCVIKLFVRIKFGCFFFYEQWIRGTLVNTGLKENRLVFNLLMDFFIWCNLHHIMLHHMINLYVTERKILLFFIVVTYLFSRESMVQREPLETKEILYVKYVMGYTYIYCWSFIILKVGELT